mmetsp:Transcript_839/g.2030  ORF Transcript_839/g.2030 Transcript_839/m.2030 type:complete len:200 (-) Transcript_839:13-612(-)|eukprot:CAMPEP_0116846624 /NCGR_PEP_ID=MMETSP0418-20121206/13944_1 /TAXON_ID=1158023 /ORGANISM="Astrosyne radiata, Strain 13vi08-1A" /LENGTH=199 /DNA_ID=CAMNT_0004477903 /DNA_START=61 /DNA_END=660 /DNA_ORIENTATION=-
MLTTIQERVAEQQEQSTTTPSRVHGADDDLEAQAKDTATVSTDPSVAVVFKTMASYSTLISLLLALPIFVILFFIIRLFDDPDSTLQEKLGGIILIVVAMVLLAIPYALAVPTAFEVRSDASIGVAMMFFTYSFPDVVEAHKVESLCDVIFRPRINFLTDLESRVCVRRRRCCDLVVSPRDVDGFIQAINDTARQMEEE